MPESELSERLWGLTSQVAGIREVVARLLAYEAHRAKDSASLFEHFSEATSHHIYQASKMTGKQPSRDAMLAQEQIQAEVDWIVTAARTMLAGKWEG